MSRRRPAYLLVPLVVGWALGVPRVMSNGPDLLRWVLNLKTESRTPIIEQRNRDIKPDKLGTVEVVVLGHSCWTQVQKSPRLQETSTPQTDHCYMIILQLLHLELDVWTIKCHSQRILTAGCYLFGHFLSINL